MEIIELELQTADLPAQLDFYTHTLGLPLLQADDSRARWQVGNTVLSFRQMAGQAPIYHFAFNVLPGSLSGHYNQLNGRVSFLVNPDGNTINDFSNWKATAFYFTDPAGNILECIDRQDLAIHTPTLPENGPFVSVSEIGLVSDDALETARVLLEQYGVPTFDKHAAMSTKNFNAVGDDRGLFILAIEGRAWYPTVIPAQSGFLRVKFRQNGLVQELVRG